MCSISVDVIFDRSCMSDSVNRLVGVSSVVIIIANLRLIASWCLSDASLITILYAKMPSDTRHH